MTNIKRVAGLALVILTGVVSIIPVQASWQRKWTIGYEKNTNGPEKKIQGTNGWYFMYSEAVNTEGKFDAANAKECIWTDKGSCRMWYDYKEMWMPAPYAEEGYDCLASDCWWRMDGNGIMDPNVKEGAVSSVIAWEAPEDGTYSVNSEYAAGSMPFDWTGRDYDDGDGLTLYLCTDTDTVDKAFCGVKPDTGKKVVDNMPSGSLKGEVELKKGEKIYIVADPGENGGSDIATVKMEINQEEGESIRTFWQIIMGAGIAASVLLIGLIIFLALRGRKARIESEEDVE